jgi:hypothetical protein
MPTFANITKGILGVSARHQLDRRGLCLGRDHRIEPARFMPAVLAEVGDTPGPVDRRVSGCPLGPRRVPPCPIWDPFQGAPRAADGPKGGSRPTDPGEKPGSAPADNVEQRSISPLRPLVKCPSTQGAPKGKRREPRRPPPSARPRRSAPLSRPGSSSRVTLRNGSLRQ